MQTPNALVCLVAAAAVTSGCGAPPRTETVVMQAVAFAPTEVTIALGDSVRWINNDPFPHTATARGDGFDSKSIAPEGAWTFTPPARGEFPYVCSLHPTMTGVLRVK
jgi:plastocyanin